jgi:FKBP-type peptidyl-prolyl cis-trans isomerase (trigger factor)
LQPDPNEPETILEDRRHSLIAGETHSDPENEWPYPGISSDLIGMSAGEEKTKVITFPEDYRFESLNGKEAEFRIAVEEVKARTLPELNDELAQTAGDFENLEALRKDIRASLEQQARETYNAEYDDKIIDQLIETSTIQYPPQMLEREIDEVLHQLEHRLEAQKMDLPTYLKTQNMDEAGLRQEASPVAENRLRRSLVLLKVSEAEKVEVGPEELQKETERTLEAMTRFMSEAELRKLGPQQLIPGLVSNIAAEMRVTKTVEKLRRIASGEAGTEDDALAQESQTGDESSGSEAGVSEGGSSEPESHEEKLTADIAEETESLPDEEAPVETTPAEDSSEVPGE